VDQLGPNALDEVLAPGRVADCYLGLLLPPGPAGESEAGTILIVGPSTLICHSPGRRRAAGAGRRTLPPQYRVLPDSRSSGRAVPSPLAASYL
jgi:hypothetical protein